MAKPITIEVTGDASKFSKSMDEVDSRLGKLGKVAAVGGAALGAGLLAGGAALFQIGSDFDEMKDTILVGTGATGEALESLYASAKTTMQNVPDSGQLVSEALTDVNKFMDLTGTQLETTTEGFLDFARLTGVDVGDAIERLDGVMTTFNMTTEDADELMGDLVRISQETGVSMEDLTTQVDKWGPSFAEAGLTAEEAAAMLGKFNAAGLDVEAAGKSFNKFLLDAAGNGLTAEEAMADLDAKMSTLTGPERLAAMEEIFGAKNAQAALTAYESGALALDDFNGLLGEGAGIVAEQTDATADFAEKWGEFKNKVLVRLEPLAVKLFTAISDGMDWINENGIPAIQTMVGEFEKFSGWVRANQDYIVGALAALATLVVVTLGPAFVVWAIAAGTAAIATVAAALPVIALVAAVAALGVAIVWLWKNWDEVWANIKTGARVALDWIVEKFTWFKDAAVGKARELGDAVVGFITGIPGRLTALASTFLDAGKTLGSKILDGVKNGITAVAGFAGDIANGVWKAVKGVINENVVDKLNNGIPDTLGAGPFKVRLPANPIPRLASGSRDFRGGYALVGEQGPELVGLPRGSSVFSARETAEMGGARGPISITVNTQTNANPREIARELAWIMKTRGR